MSHNEKTILVTGATGLQGGAVARHLRADGWQLRALVRNPDSPAAQRMRQQGIGLAIGDMEDPASLADAMTGVYGVFGVTADNPDLAREARQGKNLVDAAAKAGIAHFVFTSVGGADRDSGIGYWDSKWQVEQHLRAAGLPATVLRPVRFMENHTMPNLPLGGISGDELLHLFAPDAPVQMIAVDDIGAFAALAFGDREQYLDTAIEIAGDSRTSTETAALISAAIGCEITYRQVSAEGLGLSDTALAAFADPRGVWHADIDDLRRRHPGLTDFPTWLANGGADGIKALFQ